MSLTLFNTLTLQYEEFTPHNGKDVSLYTCGPTVYNFPHIGNYRAYIFGDILKRYLAYRGYTVKHIMNITDIDDKTIRDSQAEGKSLKEFTEFYTDAFFSDRDALNIIPAIKYTKATDYIVEMIELIETLIQKEYAYRTEDGSIYFDIGKDKEYGKLSHLILGDLKENAKGRLKKDEYEKDNAQDFALWKAWDENDGPVVWEPETLLGRPTQLGRGRPGWHIECSAMSMKELGESIDIHTGGVDNIFPHHENEIAQSECATGKQFVKYFMHNEHLLVDGQKMSKSSGNFYTLRDIENKGIYPLSFRLWLYGAHYRTRTNFTLEAVQSAQIAHKKLIDIFRDLGDLIGTVDQEYKDKLIEAMDDDLNTPKAMALLWEVVHDQNLNSPDKKATLLDFDNIFGFGLNNLKEESIPQDVIDIVILREKARTERNWSESDSLREQIKALGYEVKDMDNGPKVTKI